MFLRNALILLTMIWLQPGLAGIHVDIAYSQSYPEQRLDVYSPATYGPHPVMLWLHGGDWAVGDKGEIAETAQLFTDRDYVFVSINYSLAPTRHPAQIEQVAAAIRYVSEHIAQFGGDPARLHLMGSDAGAHLAALIAMDELWLLEQGLSPSAILGVILLNADSLDLMDMLTNSDNRDATLFWKQVFGSSPQDWDTASPLRFIDHQPAPRILIISSPSSRLTSGKENFSSRLREAGLASEHFVLPIDHENFNQKFAYDETVSDPVLAWLESLALPRINRFENLDFSVDFVSGLQDANQQWMSGEETPFLVAMNGELFAAVNSTRADAVIGAQILRKSSATGGWELERNFELAAGRITNMSSLQFTADHNEHQHDRTAELLLAGLAADDGKNQVLWRSANTVWQSLNSTFSAPLTATIVHRDQVTSSELILLGFGGTGVQSATMEGEQMKLRSEAELSGAEVVAFSIANGQVFALIAGKNGGLYRRIDGFAPSFERISEWSEALLTSGPITALASVPALDESGRELLLVTQANTGRIWRIDPAQGFEMILEFDVAAAFASAWQSAIPQVNFGANSWVSLEHPETAEVVHAIGLHIVQSQSATAPQNGAWYLLRQHGGSYSYGMVYDFSTPLTDEESLQSVRAMVISPFVSEQRKALYFSGFNGNEKSRDSAWIFRGVLPKASIRRGFWWNRENSGQGINLQPIGERWGLTLITYDPDGAPVWYSALGDIREQRFIADDDGLVRYYYAMDRQPPQQKNKQRSGEVSIQFGLDGNNPLCEKSGVGRSDALALADLALKVDGRETHWCIEPLQLGENGLASADVNGIWNAGVMDSSWAIALNERGFEGRRTGIATLFYYDEQGEPRWAMGTTQIVGGNGMYMMRSYRGSCPGCDPVASSSEPAGQLLHRLNGLCGEVTGDVSIDLQFPDSGNSRFVREQFPLYRVSTAACY